MLWSVLPSSFHQFEFIRHSRQLHALLHVASLSSILPSIIAVVIVSTTTPSSSPAPSSSPVPSSAAPPPVRQRELFLASAMKGRIDCPFESSPPSTFIQWIKDGRPMEVSGAGRVKVNAEGHLSMKTVVAADEGVYCCVAYSPLRQRIESPSVMVRVRDVPHFVLTPRPIYQRQPMQTVLMPCVCNASPTPTITWRKVGGSFPSTTRTLQDGGNLTIARLAREDDGIYECLATNPVAIISTTTLLLIEVTSRHGPQNITVETTYHSATISWHPAYDEGHPVHHLLWYRRSHFGPTLSVNSTVTSLPVGLWSTLEVVPNDTATFTLHDLEESSVYEFSIQSRLLRNNIVLSSETISAQTKNRVEGTDDREGRRLSPLRLRPSFPSVTDPRVERDSSNAPPASSDLGHLPLHPINISVRQQSDGLLISWLPPTTSPVPIESYALEYKTVGQWVTLAHQEVDKPWFLWKTVSHGVTYQFRVMSMADALRISKPSPSVTYLSKNVSGRGSSDIVAYGVLGLALAIIMVVLGSALAAVLSLRRTWSQRNLTGNSGKQNDVRYENVKYSEENHKDATDSIGHQHKDSTLAHCHDSLMTSVMDDVVGMLTHDFKRNEPDGLAFHRFHFEETV